MLNSWYLVVNSTSGNSNFETKWLKIQQLLITNTIDFSYGFTNYSKHEIELVQNAIQKGFRNIISVGGDGTLHHVVNGIMTQRYVKTSDITVGVIPLGTGNDWIKTYNIPNNIEKAIDLILLKHTILQDIGTLKLKNTATIYFNNMAGIGFDGYVANTLKKLKKFGSIAYLLSGLFGLFFYKKPKLLIEFDTYKITTNSLMTLFGICRYSGGGMQLTKNTHHNNGLLDITIVKHINLLDLLIHLPKLYNGGIVNHSKVTTYTTKKIKVTSLDKLALIQAEGEIIGSNFIEVSIIPKALQFIIK